MDQELRTEYELGYHVTTNVDEGRELAVKEELEKWVAEAGGNLMISQAPERRRLSYPINHQRQAFFGWMQFSLEDRSGLAGLDEHLRHQPDILRYVILRLEPETDKRTEALAQVRERKAKEAAAKPRPTEEKRAEDAGKLEQQVEEAIENL
ncbi:MAG TPA: 30S ribosomal protein S6 [Candidatus Paceibacterota bacterium]|nr:30S ribosomal protein S6 [Candidatus Paceibacterota bacterium]